MKLIPTQQEVLKDSLVALEENPVLLLAVPSGFGRTTLLREIQNQRGGVLLGMPEYLSVLRGHDPMAMEESLLELVESAWHQHDGVLVDDLNLLVDVVGSCAFFYQRKGFLDAVLAALVKRAHELNKWIVLVNTSSLDQLEFVAGRTGYRRLTVGDYEAIGAAYLPETAGALDFAKIHRFAPRLNVYQLRDAALELESEASLDTERFITFLHERRMASNVDLQEVQAVDLTTLKGMDDVLESLEANLVLPLVNDDLAVEYQLKPKRGVLLAGPPGTGKTTIGRALAHRLKGKFFQIDGTFIAGSENFYSRVHQIFESAKQNAPAIIFVDDGDVIFEDDRSGGFYRYLLTMLDGLESESRARVCVMMTAMNVGSLPPALIRSGRIELWLETRLPDQEARADILRELALKLPAALVELDIDAVAAAAEGLTGADIKRLVEDSKLLYAYDLSAGRDMKPVTDYFVTAVETVRANKQRYEDAVAQMKAADRGHDSEYPYPGMMPDFSGDDDE